MDDSQRFHLALIAIAILLAAAVLWAVWATVFFAITVAYVALPAYDRFRDHGLTPWWASLLTTLGVFVGVLALFLPVGYVLYERRTAIIAGLESIPETVTLQVGTVSYALEVAPLAEVSVALLRDVAFDVATATPVLAVKLTVFAMVVFAILIRGDEVTTAVRRAVPDEHRPVADAYARRTRETLVAIYVLQAITAAVTFGVALVVYAAFGYSMAFLLAVLSGILQFIPIVGPSLVVLAVVGYELTLGNVVRAILVGLVAGVLVAYLPDPLLRPRLAERTAHLPGSLYFVGFTGGLLTLGAIGVIVGPIAVGLLVESFALQRTGAFSAAADARERSEDPTPPSEE